MNSAVSLLKQVITWIAMGGIREENDIDAVRKIKMINIVSLVGILIFIPMGYLAFTSNYPLLGFFDFVMALFLFVGMIHIRKTGKYKWSVYFGMGLGGALFFYLFYTGGVKHSGHLWFYSFPLVSFFLLGSKRGVIATLCLLGACLLSLSMDDRSPSETLYTRSFQIRFALSSLVVMIIAYFFESTRKDAQEKLEIKNAELENKIKEAAAGEKKIKQTMEMVESANRAKSDFLANMSHELRTPLNHIMGFTELVVDQNFGELNPIQKEYLGDVLISSRHLLSLINDILDLSKVEAGKLELAFTQVHLKTLLEKSLVMVKEKAMKNGIQLSTRIEEDLPPTIRADERKLKQILYNLLSNAVKFTPKGGYICLKAQKTATDGPGKSEMHSLKTLPREFIRISVVDSGVGILSEHLETIFNSFEQVENSLSRKFQGTGLGLSLTRSLVELHEGWIWAESQGQGKGSCFTFEIPTSLEAIE